MEAAPSIQETAQPEVDSSSGRIGMGALFSMFLKAGLAFGGGSGIMAALQHDLVDKRRGLSRSEYLTLFALGRVTPCGNLMAMAIACGYRFQGIPGTLVSLAAMIAPSFVITLILTAAYGSISGTPLIGLVGATLLPAALGLIFTQALRLSRDVFKPSVELCLAAACFLGAAVFGISAPVLLLIGGIAGLVLIRDRPE